MIFEKIRKIDEGHFWDHPILQTLALKYFQESNSVTQEYYLRQTMFLFVDYKKNVINNKKRLSWFTRNIIIVLFEKPGLVDILLLKIKDITIFWV